MSSDPLELAALAEGVRGAEPRALARAISLLENADPRGRELVGALRGTGVASHIVGVTGPPGAGKSTLISALVREVRARGKTVGVVAVDPTSPFTSGALLGDRIRLSEHFLDPGVFIRSMGSRGHAGGLTAAVSETLLVLRAAGKDVIFVETVGAGQTELGVRASVDTVVLVLMPGSGDSVQALKAGIMEIPDLIAVNKQDLPGASATAGELRQVLALGELAPPELVMTDALHGEGTAALWELIERHEVLGAADGSLARRRGEQLVAEVMSVASTRMRGYLHNVVAADPDLVALLDEVRLGRLDPPRAVEAILRTVLPLGDNDRTHTL